jgi:hypothetical protein
VGGELGRGGRRRRPGTGRPRSRYPPVLFRRGGYLLPPPVDRHRPVDGDGSNGECKYLWYSWRWYRLQKLPGFPQPHYICFWVGDLILINRRIGDRQCTDLIEEREVDRVYYLCVGITLAFAPLNQTQKAVKTRNCTSTTQYNSSARKGERGHKKKQFFDILYM